MAFPVRYEVYNITGTTEKLIFSTSNLNAAISKAVANLNLGPLKEDYITDITEHFKGKRKEQYILLGETDHTLSKIVMYRG